MTLPAQIKAQIDRANGIIEQQRKAGETQVDEAADSAQDEQPQNEEVQSTQSQESVSQAQTVATPQQQEDENSPTYAQRWRSLQGSFNSQKFRLDEANQRIAQLEQLIATIQTAPAAPQNKQSEAFLTENDVKDYGADMVDFAKRAAREEVAPVMRALRSIEQQIAQLSGLAPTVRQVVQHQQMSAEDRFFAALQQAVPDWEDINETAKFSDWLDEIDPIFGISRRVSLNDARERLDLQRVVSLFKSFKGPEEKAVSDGQSSAKAKAASQLEKQVVPGRGAAATSAPAQRQPRVWTGASVAQFYRDKREGKYKGKEAEAQALENDIFVAQREGRFSQRAA
jgi:hypothetical protein